MLKFLQLGILVSTCAAIWSQYKKDILAIVLGQGLTLVGVLVTTRLITEVVQPTIFGEVKLYLGVVNLVAGICLAPWHQFVMRKLHDFEEEHLRLFLAAATQGILILSAVAGLCLFLGLTLYGYLRARPCAGPALLLLPIILGISYIDLSRSLYISQKRQVAASMVAIAKQWLVPAMIVLGVLAWGNAVGAYLMGNALGLFLIVLLIYHYTRMPVFMLSWPPRSLRGNELREAWAYALPLIITGIFNWIVNLGDRYILQLYTSLDNIGIYSACYGMGALPMTTLGGMIMRFWYPIYFKKASQTTNLKGDLLVIASSLLSIGLLGGGVILVFYLWGEFLIELVLAEAFRKHAFVIILWILTGHLFLATSYACDLFTYARKLTKLRARAYAFIAVLNIVLNLVLIPEHGIVGAAQATCLTFLCYLLIMLGLITKKCYSYYHVRAYQK